jgi:hypothetical protein
MRGSSRSVGGGRLRIVLPVVMSALLGACASGGVGREAGQLVPEVAPEGGETPSHAMVNNQSGDRVTVYISQGAETWRLGEVEPYSRRTLPLGNAAMALTGRSVYFIARPLAGRPYRSETFGVSPDGGMPSWTIENYTAFSYVSLR